MMTAAGDASAALYPPAPYEDELAAELRTQRTDPPRPRTRPILGLPPEDAYAVELHARLPSVGELAAPLRAQRRMNPPDLGEVPPEDVIRAVQGIYNCSRETALIQIQDDRRRVLAAGEAEARHQMRRRLFASIAPSEQWMPGMRPEAEHYAINPYTVLRGEVMPEGDLPPTGKGDPLAEAYGAFDRTMAAIDTVLDKED